MTAEGPPPARDAYRSDRDPVVLALRMARDAVQVTARADATWLRDTASDQLDHARIVGVEDAYRSALTTLDVHIEKAKAKGKKAFASEGSAMPLYRKKPVVIEAQKWNGSVGWATAIIDWMLANDGTARYHDEEAVPFLSIDTLEGTMRALPEDYVIKGVQGEFYPCKPGIFDATYEAVDA